MDRVAGRFKDPRKILVILVIPVMHVKCEKVGRDTNDDDSSMTTVTKIFDKNWVTKATGVTTFVGVSGGKRPERPGPRRPIASMTASPNFGNSDSVGQAAEFQGPKRHVQNNLSCGDRVIGYIVDSAPLSLCSTFCCRDRVIGGIVHSAQTVCCFLAVPPRGPKRAVDGTLGPWWKTSCGGAAGSQGVEPSPPKLAESDGDPVETKDSVFCQHQSDREEV